MVHWRVPEEKKEKAREEVQTPADAVLIVEKNREWGTEGSIQLRFGTERKIFEETKI